MTFFYEIFLNSMPDSYIGKIYYFPQFFCKISHKSPFEREKISTIVLILQTSH